MKCLLSGGVGVERGVALLINLNQVIGAILVGDCPILLKNVEYFHEVIECSRGKLSVL